MKSNSISIPLSGNHSIQHVHLRSQEARCARLFEAPACAKEVIAVNVASAYKHTGGG